MYTGLDILIIVIVTMAVTMLITFILFACLVVNSRKHREFEAYTEGYFAGQVESIKKGGKGNDILRKS